MRYSAYSPRKAFPRFPFWGWGEAPFPRFGVGAEPCFPVSPFWSCTNPVSPFPRLCKTRKPKRRLSRRCSGSGLARECTLIFSKSALRANVIRLFVGPQNYYDIESAPTHTANGLQGCGRIAHLESQLTGATHRSAHGPTQTSATKRIEALESDPCSCTSNAHARGSVHDAGA